MLMGYRLYGLDVASEIPLYAAPREPAQPADLVIRMGSPIGPAADPPPRDQSDWLREGACSVLRFTNPSGQQLEFEYSDDGRHLEARSTQQLDPWDLGAVLGGIALAVALLERKRPIFHAATVRIGERAALLAAVSGTGKSTLTVALVARGAALLSDDITAVRFDPSGVVCLPGASSLQLYPDSLNALGVITNRTIAARRLFGEASRDDKHVAVPAALGGTAAETAANLTACFVLERAAADAAPALHRLPAHKAALTLTKATVGNNLGLVSAVDTTRWVADLVRSVPVMALRIGSDYSHLPLAAAMIEDVMRRGDLP